MKGFRIVPAPRAKDLSGEGARRYGGRWNSPGVPMLYTATSASLAVLEALVHMSLNVFPDELVLVTLEVPQDLLSTLEPERMPEHWADYPAPAAVSEIGDLWFREEQSVGLLVPSAILPQENNLLINPRHARAGLVEIVDILPYRVDRRLLKPQ
jgi:RES domain-containing protein